jgi:hypothetical protein
MDQHEDLQELLTRLNDVRDSMEAASGYSRGIETTTGVDCSKFISGAPFAR